MVRRYVVKYMPVENRIILSTWDGFASVFNKIALTKSIGRGALVYFSQAF